MGAGVELHDLPLDGAHHVENGVEKHNALLERFDLWLDADFSMMSPDFYFRSSELCLGCTAQENGDGSECQHGRGGHMQGAFELLPGEHESRGVLFDADAQ